MRKKRIFLVGCRYFATVTILLLISVTTVESADQHNVDSVQHFLGRQYYESYEVGVDLFNKIVHESGIGDSIKVVDVSDFISTFVRVNERIPTALDGVSIFRIEVCPNHCHDIPVLVTDNLMWIYGQNDYESKPYSIIDLGRLLRESNKLLLASSTKDLTKDEVSAFFFTMMRFEFSVRTILNSWLEIYPEFAGIPFQGILTVPVGRRGDAEINKRWEYFVKFRDVLPIRVRSEIRPPEIKEVESGFALTFYLLSPNYDVIKSVIKYDSNRFEIESLDTLGSYGEQLEY